MGLSRSVLRLRTPTRAYDSISTSRPNNRKGHGPELYWFTSNKTARNECNPESTSVPQPPVYNLGLKTATLASTRQPVTIGQIAIVTV